MVDASPVDLAWDDHAEEERREIIAREQTDPDPEDSLRKMLDRAEEEIVLCRIINWLDMCAPSRARQLAVDRLEKIRRM